MNSAFFRCAGRHALHFLLSSQNDLKGRAEPDAAVGLVEGCNCRPVCLVDGVFSGQAYGFGGHARRCEARDRGVLAWVMPWAVDIEYIDGFEPARFDESTQDCIV